MTTPILPLTAFWEMGVRPAGAPLGPPPPQEASARQARTAQGAASGRGRGMAVCARRLARPGRARLRLLRAPRGLDVRAGQAVELRAQVLAQPAHLDLGKLRVAFSRL